MQLVTHPLDDRISLLLGEVGWEVLDRLDVVVDHNAAAGGVSRALGRGQLEGWPRLVADDLDFRSGV